VRALDAEQLRSLRVQLGGSAASLLRGGAGAFALFTRDPDEQPDLVLYELEGCPYSRLVREALAMLDLDALVKPCPRGASRHRSELLAARGEETVPFLVDQSCDEALGDADAIVAYLFARYGRGHRIPRRLRSALAEPTSKVASALVGVSGAEEARTQPVTLDEPLVLWAFEACPFCRAVRLQLAELALPYMSHACARGSGHRPEFERRHGKTQFPYLEDPNTGEAMFESAAIVAYLEDRYGPEAQRVAEAGLESFPASDPPSWTAG
tara:strand:+ start:4230 stop:5030 length:801 start_codon:yes stop_codon:yes gene_type:complete